jgi:hypothetical protein
MKGQEIITVTHNGERRQMHRCLDCWKYKLEAVIKDRVVVAWVANDNGFEYLEPGKYYSHAQWCDNRGTF